MCFQVCALAKKHIKYLYFDHNICKASLAATLLIIYSHFMKIHNTSSFVIVTLYVVRIKIAFVDMIKNETSFLNFIQNEV